MMNSFVSAMLSAANGIDFHPEAISEMLPKLGEGMLCIFLVIGISILLTMLLNKLTSKKDK